MLLRGENIHFSYNDGEQWALENVGLHLSEGNILGLVGPNGSGKSTLLRILAGILQPQRGYVLFQEKDIRKTDHKVLARNIAFLPQSILPVFPLSVEEMVALGRFPYQKALGFPTGEDLSVITRGYIQARYALAPPAVEQAQAVSRAWEQLQAESGDEGGLDTQVEQ